MRTRSHSKAFRKAILLVWWLPLFLGMTTAALRYSFNKDMPDEWIALGKISLTLPDGQVPDDATVQAHISLLESPSMAERARTHVMEADSEIHLFNLPERNIEVTQRNGGVLVATASGPDALGTQAFLHEGMQAYLTMAEIMRRDPPSARE